MSQQQWKALALFLISLFIGFVILVGIPPLSDKVLAQITSISQCGVAPDAAEFQALYNLVELYGVITDKTCKNGEFRGEHPEVRADIADWLQAALDKVNERMPSGNADRIDKAQLDELNQLYEKLLAQVKTLESQMQSH